MREPVKRCPHGYAAWETYCDKCLKADHDRLRAELERTTNLATHDYMNGQAELSAVRAELANARLERDNIALLNSSLIAELAEAKESLRLSAHLHTYVEALNAGNAALGAKDARIAELEGLLAYGTDTDAYRRIRSRAERAEARIAELETDHLFAENKRLREACQEFRARVERAEAGRVADAADYEVQEENYTSALSELDAARLDWRAAIARAERAEAEADSLRSTIDNMRAMNIKLTWEAAGKVLAAEAELKARAARDVLAGGKLVEPPLLDQFKNSLDTRLNDVLCEMKEGYDDSIVGFNEAWDIMRKAYKDFKARAPKG